MLFISPALWTQCPCREKAQRTSNALVFLGLMFALRIQPHKGTKSASCGSLALRTRDRRAVRRSECDPHLLLTQQKPCHRKSYELSWWKLISNRSWLSGGEANSRQRNGNGLSLPQVQSTLVCAVINCAKAGTVPHYCQMVTGAPVWGQDSCRSLQDCHSLPAQNCLLSPCHQLSTNKFVAGMAAVTGSWKMQLFGMMLL